MKWMAASLPALRIAGAAQAAGAGPAIEPGPFEGTRQSLESWRVPEWYRDAKFGIWAHWGPQSAPEAGDWYARNMYMQGSPQYEHHLKHYGHPTKFGFKDVIPTWRADRFDADHLIGLYKKAGARYFVSMGVHHDNFDLWNSKHTRWNAKNMGPRKDIVGLFRDAARKHGLRFGVSDHLWISYKWFSVSHGSDRHGPLAGKPYDGVDPANADLYHDVDHVYPLDWNENGIPESWKRHWFDRIKDLIDHYQPDLLYCDGHIPFEQYGLSILAHLYNTSAKLHGGNVEALYTSKRREDSQVGTCLLDVERGLVQTIWPQPWQTDTCVGDWHYKRDIHYKSPKTVIDLLVDIVSRNGNLLLNFPLPNSGMPDDRELAIVDEITRWMAVNSEAIYATRPWKIFGEGPDSAPGTGDAKFNENKRKPLGPRDVRFTTKGQTMYVFLMGWPDGPAVVPSLAPNSGEKPPKVLNVELLGHAGPLKWEQGAKGLEVHLPAEKPCDHVFVLKLATRGV